MKTNNAPISFLNDYSYSAHPKIMNALLALQGERLDGYGCDSKSYHASSTIRKLLRDESVDVHYLPGGTCCNLTAIASFLKPYEAVIAASSAHISTHEAGAIEATGHKILICETEDGKLRADQVDEITSAHSDEHMVKPRLVFISNPTEIGTVYTDKDISALRKICNRHHLYLYIDGARLSMALAALDGELSLPAINKAADAFYFGGTKNGILFGEALIIRRRELQMNFRHSMKQRGALVAKGFLIGAQFEELLKGELHLKLARHANKRAQELADGIKRMGYGFLCASSTNQIFPIIDNAVLEKLEKDFLFYPWQAIDETRSAIRMVTSWATSQEETKSFLAALHKYSI